MNLIDTGLRLRMLGPSPSLKDLFLAAPDLDPAVRAAWLDCHCPDPDRRRHLNLLFAAHDAPQSLLTARGQSLMHRTDDQYSPI